MSKTDKLFSQYKKKLVKVLDEDSTYDNGEYKDVFLNADPTNNKKYLRWILDSYVNGGINHYDDLYGRVPTALKDYTLLLNAKKLDKRGEKWENETVIDNFCGLSGCEKKGMEKLGLDSIIDKYSEYLETKSSEKQEMEDIVSERDVFCDNSDIRVVIPHTERAACYYGQGTKWCTAATRGSNMFETYNEDGNLYTIIPKNPTYKGEKYQLHIERGQFMDEKDDDADLREVLSYYPDLYDCLLPVFSENIVCEENHTKLLFVNSPLSSQFFDKKEGFWLLSNGKENYMKDDGMMVNVDGDLIDIETFLNNNRNVHGCLAKAVEYISQKIYERKAANFYQLVDAGETVDEFRDRIRSIFSGSNLKNFEFINNEAPADNIWKLMKAGILEILELGTIEKFKIVLTRDRFETEYFYEMMDKLSKNPIKNIYIALSIDQRWEDFEVDVLSDILSRAVQKRMSIVINKIPYTLTEPEKSMLESMVSKTKGRTLLVFLPIGRGPGVTIKKLAS